jgi:3-oxoacyl-[acyl-carrier protein] reductase
MNDLKNKAVLVTGASTGIGAAVARALGQAGAQVAVHYRGSAEAARQVARDIEAAAGRALLVQADVTDSAAVDRMVKTVHAEFGRIDVLVNNAGGFVRRAPIVDADDDYIGAVFRLNARSVVGRARGWRRSSGRESIRECSASLAAARRKWLLRVFPIFQHVDSQRARST